MEVGAKLSLDDLEAGSDKMNGWRPGVVKLREANRARVAAQRAPYLFIPLIGHWGVHHTGLFPRVYNGTLGQIQIRPFDSQIGPLGSKQAQRLLISGHALCQEPPPLDVRRSRYRCRGGGAPSG